MLSFPWKSLLDWYEINGRHTLPWREYQTGSQENRVYQVWLSEIFLQQTQVSRVVDYFLKVTRRFPTIQSLADTEYDTFFPYYQGLGYYSRARNILKTAKKIVEQYNGIFPKEKEKLMKLPGVGAYTANAILAFGYGETFLAWDTNLEKVFSRYYKGRKDIKLSAEEREEIEAGFHDFIEGITNYELRITNVRAINNALMDFAALIDLKNSLSIDWEKYPIQSGEFYNTRGTLEPVEVKKTVTFPIPDATVIVVLHKEHKVYYSPRHPEQREGSRNGEPGFSSRDVIAIVPQNDATEYGPFVLPPPLHRDTRNYVQEYFRSNYSLEVSVRPIHKKWISEDGKPYVLVNAQIQTGKHHFMELSKKEYLSFLKRIE